jgi:metal-responsive CopG/Arc/MetJ family transcriptional regulator
MKNENKYYPIKTVSFKVEEPLLLEIDKNAKSTNTNRSTYIKVALEAYNEKMQEERLAEQMHQASLKIREDSVAVLKDFEALK